MHSPITLLLKHYATEALLVVPTLPVVLLLLYLSKRFAWSDGTTTAAMIGWIVVWGAFVILCGERVLQRIGYHGKRKQR